MTGQKSVAQSKFSCTYSHFNLWKSIMTNHVNMNDRSGTTLYKSFIDSNFRIIKHNDITCKF